jgi:hypothetical protein
MAASPPEPTFLIIGAQKAATTSVYYGLRHHPDVFLCTPKEIHFFSLERVFARGWDWYLSYFAEAGARTAIGEASTSYSSRWLRPRAAPRIKQALPDARIIYVVRHPLRRIESHWMHQWRFSQTQTDFVTAVRTNRELIDCSLYWHQISAYRELYDDARIRVIFAEDLAQDTAGELRRILEFIDLDPAKLPISPRLNRVHNPSLGPAASQEKRSLSERPTWDAALLADVGAELRDDAERLLAFCGKPAGYWRDL